MTTVLVQATKIYGRRTKVKVKESRNRPGVAQRIPGGLGSRISFRFMDFQEV
jgi:hypothetical protein